jgi:hypothetical protein
VLVVQQLSEDLLIGLIRDPVGLLPASEAYQVGGDTNRIDVSTPCMSS